MFKHLVFILLILVSCKEEKKEVDVYEIKNIGILATTEYTFGKVIELKDNQTWYKFGDRNILISCKANVKAGIDLNKIKKEDISFQNNSISINLPYPTIVSFDMNPNDIETEMEDISGFRTTFTHQEKNNILKQGEQSIRKAVEKSSIIETAKKNSKIFIIDFYKNLGFKDVTVTFLPLHEETLY